jgi:hypothetical protein
MTDQGGWMSDGIEVWPVGEEHVIGGAEVCPCRPWMEDGIIVHRAYDMRELTEPGGQRPLDG